MNKVLFVDIDGPLIPGRAYMLPGNMKPLRTGPFVQAFDPVAVSLLNSLAKDRDYRFVLHTSWLRVIGPRETLDHCVQQGLSHAYFHDDPWCNPEISWRYDRLAEWLARHPEVNSYAIIDDDPYKQGDTEGVDVGKNLILVDFEEGLTMRNYRQLRDGKFTR